MGPPPADGGTAERLSKPARGQRIPAQARFALFLALWIPAVAMWLRSGLTVPPVPFMTGPLPMVAALAASALSASVGLAISLRRHEVRTGRFLAWAAWALALNQVTWAYLALAETSATLPDPAVAAWLNSAVAFPVATAVIVALVAVFPTDRPESRAGRSAIVLAAIAVALVFVGGFLRPGPMPLITRYESPFGSADMAAVGAILQVVGWATVVAASVMATLSVLLRYRGRDAVTRAQLRVFMGVVFFAAGAFVLMIVTSIAELGTLGLRDLIAGVALAAVALIPLAVFATIARYRLFQIDRLVSRSFVYGALTAIVAGLTAASIQGLTALSKLVAGGSSDLVVVFTTLILVSVSAPIKARLESVAARLTRDPDPLPTVAIPLVTQTPGRPAEFDDPAFLAAFDARTRAVLATELRRQPAEFDDPAFLAAFDARMRAVVAAEHGPAAEPERLKPAS
jgi:hypothetical protein